MGGREAKEWTEADSPSESIKNKNSATGERDLFKDTTFPTDGRSLYHKKEANISITWKRPHKLSKRPEFENRFLIQKVFLNDAFPEWQNWTKAIAAISTNPACLVKSKTPAGQTLNGKNYNGMFHFRFWTLGSWTDVVVDDYLPVIGSKLAFTKVDKKDPYWVSLMQKAYAKHCGSYQAVGQGDVSEFLEDFTGGFAITYKLGSKSGDDVYRTLEKAARNHSFICCSKREMGKSDSSEYIDRCGYTVRNTMRTINKGSPALLIELVTPHQREPDWSGDWSVGSKIFDEAEHLHGRLGYTKFSGSSQLVTQLCGVFYMDFKNFKEYFRDVTILATGKKFQEEAGSNFYGGQDNWLHCDVKGTWEYSPTKDGAEDELCDNMGEERFAESPQYFMKLTEPDAFNLGDDPAFKSKCFVFMELMQKITRKSHTGNKHNSLFIALHVFKVHRKPTSKLSIEFFRENKAVADTGKHCDPRQVSIATDLDPGHYVLIPSVLNVPKKDSPYLLRVYAERQTELTLL